MTEETKQRLRERFEQILSQADKKPRTIDGIAKIALQVRDKVTQAVVEEVAQAAQENVESSSESQRPIDSKICCPHCQKSAWDKGKHSRQFLTRQASSFSAVEPLCLTQAKPAVEGFLADRACKNLPKAFSPRCALSDSPEPAVL